MLVSCVLSLVFAPLKVGRKYFDKGAPNGWVPFGCICTVQRHLQDE